MTGDNVAVTVVPEAQGDADRPRRRWYRAGWIRFLSWTGTAGVLGYTAVRLFGLETGWLLSTTVAFVPYFVIAALAGAGLQAALRHWPAAAVTGLAVVALAAVLVPRIVADEQPPARGAELTVMSVNLYVGHTDLGKVIDLVEEHRPDLLSLQELTPAAVQGLAELGIGKLLPYSLVEPGELAVGTGLYATHPLTRIESVGRNGIFHQIGAEVDVDGEAIRFMAVHTAAPASPERIPLWEEDFASLPRPDGGTPWILAGDFNATLDHANLRELIGAGFVDAAEAVGKGLDTTWRPIDGGYLNGLVRPPAVALDHVLAEEGIAVRAFAVLDMSFNGTVGSDHAPVLAHLQLP